MESRSWINSNVQYDRIIIILLAVIITIPVILKSRPSRSIPVSAAFLVTSSLGYVRVSGDIRHPGIYPVTANMLTVDAIKMAEPLRPATTYIPDGCEALLLHNGTGIRVSRSHGGGSEVFLESMSTAQRIVLGIPLDINAMTEDDFDLIPGVGPVLARRIVEYRQLNGGKIAATDLIFIDGIGDKKFISLKKYFN